MTKQKQINIEEYKAFKIFYATADLAGFRQEAWIFFMREIKKGATVHAAIRYTRKKWNI